jgi:hypothetical protein
MYAFSPNSVPRQADLRILVRGSAPEAWSRQDEQVSVLLTTRCRSALRSKRPIWVMDRCLDADRRKVAGHGVEFGREERSALADGHAILWRGHLDML